MIKKILFWSFLLIFVAIGAFSTWIYQIIVTLQNPLTISQETEFEVKEGATWDTILDDFVSEGLINRTYGATIYTRFRNFSPKQGTYRLTSGVKLGSTLDTIHRGIRSRPEVTITIPEGSDIQEIGIILEQVLPFSGEDFSEAASDFDLSNYDFVQSESLEGYLFPDTYRFFTTANPEDVIRRMLETFQIKALPVLQATDKLSAYEVLILASIIEKEVITTEDRRVVSGIFMNRLRDGMMLQSDATLNYIVREGRDRATAQDLAIESPYNTYKVTGLPPTPITNMGIDSISAALEPKEHDLFFFITTRESPPRTIFSRNFDEHLEAIRIYLE